MKPNVLSFFGISILSFIPIIFLEFILCLYISDSPRIRFIHKQETWLFIILISCFISFIIAILSKYLFQKYCGINKISILLFSLICMYWYTPYYLPFSIVQIFYQNHYTPLIYCLTLGPSLFFLPSIFFIWMCKKNICFHDVPHKVKDI